MKICARMGLYFVVLMGLAGLTRVAAAADEAGYTRQEDVIYGRKYGTALTMDIFT